MKTGNGLKHEEMDQKKIKKGNWEFKTFFKTGTDPKNEETDWKYWEIPQKYMTHKNLNPTKNLGKQVEKSEKFLY